MTVWCDGEGTHITVGSEGAVSKAEVIVGFITPADGGVTNQSLHCDLGVLDRQKKKTESRKKEV